MAFRAFSFMSFVLAMCGNNTIFFPSLFLNISDSFARLLAPLPELSPARQCSVPTLVYVPCWRWIVGNAIKRGRQEPTRPSQASLGAAVATSLNEITSAQSCYETALTAVVWLAPIGIAFGRQNREKGGRRGRER